MAPIRLGVIGLSANGGWAATDLIPPIFDPLLADKYTLTALCVSSEQSAKAAVEKYSALAGRTVKGYHGKQGHREIANDPEVDMVVVSVKVPEHYEALAPAIKAGKKIFAEWAPGKNMVETLQLAEAARTNRVKSMVAAQGVYTAYARKVGIMSMSGFHIWKLMMLLTFNRLKNSSTPGKSAEFCLLRL
jgi:predicted dehydrogenase